MILTSHKVPRTSDFQNYYDLGDGDIVLAIDTTCNCGHPISDARSYKS
jgi:hypothetical protein